MPIDIEHLRQQIGRMCVERDVVHARLAQSMAPAEIRSFHYRAQRPAFLSGEPITLVGALEESGASLSARLANGAESMSARALW